MTRALPRLRSFVLACVCGASTVTYGQTQSAQPSAAPPLPVIRFCTSPAIFPQVNVRDAEIAMELWTSQMQPILGFQAMLELHVIDDMQTIETELAAGHIDVLALTVMNYLDMITRLPLRPEVVPQRGGEILSRQLLLVHREAGIDDVTQLAGRRVLVSTLDRGQTAHKWLDVLLLRQGYGPTSAEKVTLELRNRPGHAVPPVLFGQADASIVDEVTYELLCEMNPQLRRDLRIIAASPSLMTRVMCSRIDMDPALRGIMFDTAMRMHTEPTGAQILALLQTERPEPFREEFLDNVRALLEEHEQLHRAWVARTSRP